MSELRPVPRAAVITAGGIIVLSAAAGLGIGILRDLKGGPTSGEDAGEIVAPIKAQNAQPLTAAPVTEADVRRWAREEMQAASARAVKRASDDAAAANPAPDASAAQAPAAPATPPLVPGQPISGPIAPAKPAPQQQPAPQIPF